MFHHLQSLFSGSAAPVVDPAVGMRIMHQNLSFSEEKNSKNFFGRELIAYAEIFQVFYHDAFNGTHPKWKVKLYTPTNLPRSKNLGYDCG